MRESHLGYYGQRRFDKCVYKEDIHVVTIHTGKFYLSKHIVAVQNDGTQGSAAERNGQMCSGAQDVGDGSEA